ncbi:hypothetical protein ABIQ69_14570 [Agromyces sp. G08B096]|uniref:Secreted protein n=1 Tax=Agromyces sp. G08B096 TaxID=3156399 RepID=A0AAU7W5Y5_9MICO
MHHLRNGAALAAAAGFLLALGAASPATAAGSAVCPQTDGWTKVEEVAGDATSIGFAVPDGYKVVATCVKSSTVVAYAEVDETDWVEFESPAFNGRGTPKAISHYAYVLVEDDDRR